MTTRQTLTDLRRSLDRDQVSLTVLADGSGVILDMDGSHVLSVNAVGMCLLNALKAGVATEDELVAAVCAEYDVDVSRARQDVQAFIEQASRWLGGSSSPPPG